MVDACALGERVSIVRVKRSVRGNLTYTADVCITRLEDSTLSLQFEDTETPCRYSFIFTANAITSVICRREGQNCVVTVEGTGTIDEIQHPFVAVFRDRVAQAANDIVQSFVITGVFAQTEPVSVSQGSIVALGCQSL